MQVLLNAVVVMQILSALVMIGLVLIQHGKGADMGASFGSGSAGSLFGASGGANFLSRSTAIAATVFFCCTLALTFLSGRNDLPAAQSSVLDRAAVAASGASVVGAAASAAASSPVVAASGIATIPAK
jgi:preprotein translocase subunit SecG